MKKEMEDQFDAVFAEHSRKLQSEREAKATQESREEAFERAFRERRSTSYKPALERIAQFLNGKGLETRIDETEASQTSDGRRQQDTAIVIHFLVGDRRLGVSPSNEKRYYSEHEQPYLRLTCDKHKQVVTLYENTVSPGRGGHGGSTGSFTLEQLTDDLIEKKVLAVVREALN